ncbi:MAG: TIGR00266 family protein [Bacteroidales bacterium]|nr:TIGR00266 family protein [Bacteroidales bacterium]
MKSHEVDYKIYGDDIQVVEIELDNGETVIAEAGTMLYMEDGIIFETKMGDGSNPNQGFMSKMLSAGSRLITGESLFLTHFTHQGTGKSHVAFAAPYPGTIMPMDLSQFNGSLIVQKDGFLCAAFGTKLSIHFNKRLGAGFLGGEGFILQKLTGDGKVFVHAGGTMIEKQLNNETLRIDTGCIVAFEEGIDFNIESAGNLKSMIFGGEGLFLATLRGTGRVWLQSLPISKLIRALSPRGKNVGKESRSLLGNFLQD